MSVPLFVLVPIVGVVLICAVLAVVFASSLPIAARVVAGLVLAAAALFSIYGFMSTFEMSDTLIWRVVYSAIFITCLGGVAHLTLARRTAS